MGFHSNLRLSNPSVKAPGDRDRAGRGVEFLSAVHLLFLQCLRLFYAGGKAGSNSDPGFRIGIQSATALGRAAELPRNLTQRRSAACRDATILHFTAIPKCHHRQLSHALGSSFASERLLVRV